MKRQAKDILTGALLIIMAGLIVVCNVIDIKFFNSLSIWQIILSVFLLFIAIKSISHKDFFFFFIPMACIYLLIQGAVRDTFPGVPHIGGWPLILGAALLSAGFHMLFKNHSHVPHVSFTISSDSDDAKAHLFTRGKEDDENNGQGCIDIDSSFRSLTRYVECSDFRRLDIDNSFGQVDVYLSNVTLASAQCIITIDNSFGSTNLYLPKEWRVSLDEDPAFGDVKFNGKNDAPADAPIAYIKAETSFGKVEIFQI